MYNLDGDYMQKNRYWHRLDNAAKIFPAISKKDRSNVFRLSFYLKDDIDPVYLNIAVNETLKRIQVFNVQLKNGIFWNFFSENKRIFKVEPEPSEICKFFKFNKNNGYLFKVYYLNNKITLETFHALTDGTGALHFLKSIVYKYLELCGYNVYHEGKILSEMPFSNKENEDSFVTNYNSKIKQKLTEEKAYHIKGDHFKDNWTLLFKIKVNTNDFKDVVKKYNVSLTEYVAALIGYSIYDEGVNVKVSKKPIKVFVPVNLRPYFNSYSLRNFSLYIKNTYDPQKEWTFEDMLTVAKSDFEQQLTKNNLHMRLGSLVGIEKNFLIRITPLFLKNIFFKIGYHILGESINTISLSNLGVLDLPDSLKDYVLDVDFVNTSNSLASTIISYNNTTNIIFTSAIKDLSIIKSFINQLKKDGLDITIETNYWEDYDEIL